MTIQQINDHVSKIIKDANEQLKKYEGMDAIIPEGKFKGRLGKIEKIFLNFWYMGFPDGMAVALIRPYHLKYGRSCLLSYAQQDVRTYWPITDKDIIK